MKKSSIIEEFADINTNINKQFEENKGSYNYCEYTLKNYQGKKEINVRSITKTKGIPTIYSKDITLTEEEYLYLLERFTYNIAWQKRTKAKFKVNTYENKEYDVYYLESISDSLSAHTFQRFKTKYSITTDKAEDLKNILSIINKLNSKLQKKIIKKAHC